MVHRGEESGLIVFIGPTGDHNDRGMAGASIMGEELGRRLDLTPTVIGTPQPATSDTWSTALPAALPGLRELQRSHHRIVECGDVPIAALPRCAASLATLPTIAQHHPEAVVVWFDAHADLNTPDNTTTGYLGGLVLSAALGWWDSGLGAGLHPNNVVLGGTRDLDAPEQALVDAGTIKLAAGPTLQAMLDQHVGDRPVYFHLDCDVLEPGTVPTDYRVPHGLTLDDLAAVSRRLSQNHIVGIEIAEFEAAADPTDDTNYAQPLLDALAPLLTTVHAARL
jgi:arginase